MGYRVNFARGTQFRQWAPARVEEYVVKGFTMDDERRKQREGGGYYWVASGSRGRIGITLGALWKVCERLPF